MRPRDSNDSGATICLPRRLSGIADASLPFGFSPSAFSSSADLQIRMRSCGGSDGGFRRRVGDTVADTRRRDGHSMRYVALHAEFENRLQRLVSEREAATCRCDDMERELTRKRSHLVARQSRVSQEESAWQMERARLAESIKARAAQVTLDRQRAVLQHEWEVLQKEEVLADSEWREASRRDRDHTFFLQSRRSACRAAVDERRAQVDAVLRAQEQVQEARERDVEAQQLWELHSQAAVAAQDAANTRREEALRSESLQTASRPLIEARLEAQDGETQLRLARWKHALRSEFSHEAMVQEASMQEQVRAALERNMMEEEQRTQASVDSFSETIKHRFAQERVRTSDDDTARVGLWFEWGASI